MTPANFTQRRADLAREREQGLLSEREHRRQLARIERDERAARIEAAALRAAAALERAP